MIKLVYCLRRKPGMTWDEFSTYWHDVHAPLVAERAEALGIRRYVQVRTADNPASMRRSKRATADRPSRSTAWLSCGSTTMR